MLTSAVARHRAASRIRIRAQDDIGELIDDEIHRLMDEAYARALSILRQHRAVLDCLARALLGSETLDAPAIEHIFQNA